MAIPKIIKDIFWKNPFLSVEQKDQLYYELKKIIRHEGVTVDSTAAEPLIEKYIAQILAVPSARSIVIFLILDLKDSLRIRN